MEQIEKIKCITPFTTLQVHWSGVVQSCCPTWHNLGSLGVLNSHNSIEEVWNGEKIQMLRKAVLEKDFKKICNFRYCPVIQSPHSYNLNDNLEYILSEEIKDEIRQGKTKLDTYPFTLEVACFSDCNLRCRMCSSHGGHIPPNNKYVENFFEKILPEALPKIHRLMLSGNGDPLFNKYSRRFLQNLKPDDYPNLQIRLLTNGMMLTPKIWNTIKHNKYESIHISVDAATKETYEYIRRGGKWEVLLQNLELVSQLRKEGTFAYFTVSFCVMKSNYKEMRQFVELGLQLGADRIQFQKIFDTADVRENINITNNKKVMIEIAKILQDPIFEHECVETYLINEYKQYLDKKASRLDNLRSSVMGQKKYLLESMKRKRRAEELKKNVEKGVYDF